MQKWYLQFSTILFFFSQETAIQIVTSGKIGALHEKLHAFFQEVDSTSQNSLDKHLNILHHIGAKLVCLHNYCICDDCNMDKRACISGKPALQLIFSTNQVIIVCPYPALDDQSSNCKPIDIK